MASKRVNIFIPSDTNELMGFLQLFDFEQEGGNDDPQQTEEITENGKRVKKKQVNVSQKYNFGTLSFQGTQKERITFFELSISKKK